MANYIRNIVTINESGERLQRLLDAIKGENGAIDFDRIIPMPKEEEENWYRWRLDHWDTKWNAYDINREVDFGDDRHITFNTAWSAPYGIYLKLFAMFPDYDMEIAYADEDVAYNCGRITLKDGHITTFKPRPKSDEAYALYLETHPENEPYLYKDEDGEWNWHDEPDYERCP